jgi:hypothetical protein
LDPRSPKFLLRERLAYPHHSVYYLAIFANIALRMMWVWSFSWNFLSGVEQVHPMQVLLYFTSNCSEIAARANVLFRSSGGAAARHLELFPSGERAAA